MTLFVSAEGARSETSARLPDGKGGTRDIRFVALFRTAEPKKTVMLNDEQKTYAVVTRDDVPETQRKQPKVERVGTGKVAGYGCEKVRISQDGGGGHQEVCVTKELGKVAFLGRMAADDRDDVLAALRRAGLDGIPVAWRSFEEGGKPGVSMELASARKQRVPASLFAVPAGYTESSMAGVFASPEQAKQMDEAMKQMQEQMKDMTPEQRKQMEEMMKRMGAGKK
jgi:hypothetical protein